MSGRSHPAPPKRPVLRRRTQEQRSAATRAALLRAAVAVIGDGGWAAATTRQVAARAGVSRGALQHTFASRAELLGAVADEMFVKLHAPLETAALAGAPLASRVAMILDHYHRIYASALYRAVVSASLDPRSGVRRQLQRRVNENQDLMSRNWQEAFADLGIADQDLHATRRLAMSLVRGYAIVPASGGGYWERDVAEVQALIVGRLERYGRKRPGRPTV